MPAQSCHMSQTALQHQESRPDAELVRLCIANQSDAWSELVVTNREHVRWAIVHAGRSQGVLFTEHDLDDIESSLFLRLMVDDARRLRNFQGHATLRGWLRVVAANLAIDRARTHRRAARRNLVLASPEEHDGHSHPINSLPDPNADTEAQLQRRQLHERLHVLCAQLSHEDQRFIDLFFVQEIDFQTISDRTGITTAALYTRKNRIRKRLIALAEKDGWFEDGARSAR
jgi:RNA polymerase sigma factor (sigma-70 family)